MKIMPFTLALLGALMWLTPTTGAADKIKLGLKLEKGQKFVQEMVAKQNITQSIQGFNQEIEQTIGMTMAQTIEEVDENGLATVSLTYDAVKMSQNSQLGRFDYDSKNPPANVPAQARGMAALVGEGFKFQLTPDGHIKKVVGADKMIENIVKKMNLPPGPQRDMMTKTMKQQFGDKGIEAMMGPMFSVYPDGPVGVGESWTRKMTLASVMPMKLDNTYKLVKRKDGQSFVEVTSKISPNKDGKPLEAGPVKMTFQMNGKQNGTLMIDEGTGWVRTFVVKQDMSGKMTVEQAGQSFSIPMTIKSTTTVTTVDGGSASPSPPK